VVSKSAHATQQAKQGRHGCHADNMGQIHGLRGIGKVGCSLD
jgi:hypothetical protein